MYFYLAVWSTWLIFGWFWSWPGPWIFKVKFGICTKVVRLPRNKKQAYQLNSRPQMWTSVVTYFIDAYLRICFNSLWPSSTIWSYRSVSKLAQVMAWLRQAPSHNLKFWTNVDPRLLASIPVQFHRKCASYAGKNYNLKSDLKRLPSSL